MKENEVSLVKTRDGHNYLVPFMLITLLFFMWGFANSTHGVLNKFFQDAMNLKSSDTAWIQAMVYGAYFVMAVPASMVIDKFGYKSGVMTGLCLFGMGALLFYPASIALNFTFFLFALFVLGCGMACLETSCNPYATRLGEPESGVRRLNIAQGLNGLGCIFGPTIGLLLYSDDASSAASAAGAEPDLLRVAIPYICMGLVAFAVAVMFIFVKLPDISDVAKGGDDAQADGASSVLDGSLIKNKAFLLGALALFMYVGAQTVLNSYFISYTTSLDGLGITAQTASLFLAFGAMTLFLLGRVLCSWIMKFVKASLLLMGFADGAVLCMLIIALQFASPMVNLILYLLAFFFESMMFPSIFALSIDGMGKKNTQKASAILIMCIVGGAVIPLVMAAVEQSVSMAFSFIVPAICFVFVQAFASYKALGNKAKNDK